MGGAAGVGGSARVGGSAGVARMGRPPALRDDAGSVHPTRRALLAAQPKSVSETLQKGGAERYVAVGVPFTGESPEFEFAGEPLVLERLEVEEGSF
ncbi:hypothetical protein B7R54_07025 [Subtercola boreus]|uniref:Uncharacterized protein n=1 Tax=Subtercola boreus TaxID=120213 RepID=A0A3E0VHZ0_9MICO|nr:hypothetical protein B7R54_07025 [Subtercola boreus]TQL54003.1 hypothetical protein FB464_1529 [Subtercola boreus]